MLEDCVSTIEPKSVYTDEEAVQLPYDIGIDAVVPQIDQPPPGPSADDDVHFSLGRRKRLRLMDEDDDDDNGVDNGVDNAVGETSKRKDQDHPVKKRNVIEESDDDDNDELLSNENELFIKARQFERLKELSVENRVPLKWVKVVYEGEIFLGKIQNVHPTGKCLVKCLDRPFGVDEGKFQDLESDEVWFDVVYVTDVEPAFLVDETKGKTHRQKSGYIYIYIYTSKQFDTV